MVFYGFKQIINIYKLKFLAVIFALTFSGNLLADQTDNTPATNTQEAVDENQFKRGDILNFNTNKVLTSLTKGLGFYNEIPDLPKSSWIGRDQKSAEKDLNKIITEVIVLLESPEINRLKNQLNQLENKIEEEKTKILDHRAKRVLAVEDDRSLRTKLVPGETCRLKRKV